MQPNVAFPSWVLTGCMNLNLTSFLWIGNTPNVTPNKNGPDHYNEKHLPNCEVIDQRHVRYSLVQFFLVTPINTQSFPCFFNCEDWLFWSDLQLNRRFGFVCCIEIFSGNHSYDLSKIQFSLSTSKG